MGARLRSWIEPLLRRARWERDMRDELEFHVRARAEHLASEGLDRAEALRRARLEFGAVERWKEDCRGARGLALADEFGRNLRDAWRSARRSPGFVVIAVLSLALGIGANIAVFALLRQLLLSPLPVLEPERLHQVVLSTVRRPYYRMPYTKYETLRQEFPIFETLFGWGNHVEGDVIAGDRTEQGRMILVTGSYFAGLGVRPEIGRMISDADDRPGGGSNVAVISVRMWQRLFNGDPGALGRSIKVRELTLQVIGVTPVEFVGTEPADPVDVYVPVHALQPTRPNLITGTGLMWMHVMARLKRDVPVESAQAMLQEGWSRIDRLAQARRGDNTRPEYMVLEDGSHGYSSVRSEFSRPVIVLMALVVIVFLIACANLASLLFVRASRRAGELTLRMALGADRGAIVRQWLTECLLLSLVGGAAGLLAAGWITTALLQFVPEANRAGLQFRTTGEVLVFSTVLSVAAACLFGWIPTLRASRASAQDVLRAHGPSLTPRRGRIAEIVLAGQLAASLILVVGALLFARTLSNLNEQSTGFERRTVVYASPEFYRVQYPREQIPETMRKVIETLQRSPRIATVAIGPVLSGGAGGWGWVKVPGYTLAPGEDNVVYHYYVSPGYFRTVAIPIIAGRDFDEADATAKPGRVIVSEKLARHYFSGQDPIGRQITIGANPPVEIVGVVRDIIDATLRTPPNELVYWPRSLYSWGDVVARAAPGVDPAAVEAELRAAIAAAATRQVPVQSGRMEDAVQKAISRERLVSQLSAALGLIGVFLASIGLFGAVAHWASGRTRELGIRMMLGATRWHVAWIVLRQALVITGLGVVAGVPLSVAAATLIEPLLFRVSPSDVVAHAVSITVMTTAGLLAACWPAWRAARLNPLEALRYE